MPMWAATSTVVLRMRFWLAPISSSPSSSRSGRSAPFATWRNGTLPASLTSVTRARSPASSSVSQSGSSRLGAEERDDGEGTVDDRLAGQDGGEQLGNLGDFVQRWHRSDPPLVLARGGRFGESACMRSVTGMVTHLDIRSV